jgi:H/ACA ribonucleoprotein complex subunit 4
MLNDSVIIIDKPPGLASHEVTTTVKKITGVSRAGHAGTLDPEVSGVLPIALGKSTKFLRYMSGKDKTYVGIIKFKEIQEKAAIEGLFKEFTGEIVQTPPRMSAVRKVPRKRTVHHLKLLEVKGRLALFEAKVDAGTYIRTLCVDIGRKCGGARMEELRRSAVGDMTEKDSFTMEELTDAVWFKDEKGEPGMLQKMLRKPEELIGFPRVSIKESSLKSVLTGAQIMVPAIESMEDAEKGSRMAIYCGERFLGVGVVQMSKAEIGERGRGLAVRLERLRSK